MTTLGSEAGGSALLAFLFSFTKRRYVKLHKTTLCQTMSHKGHVWTAPWQELSDDAALVGCGHVSGPLMRRGWPLALMPCAIGSQSIARIR